MVADENDNVKMKTEHSDNEESQETKRGITLTKYMTIKL